MHTLQELKSFSPEGHSLDELAFLLATANSMAQVYAERGGEVPEWLSDARHGLEKEIDSRQRDELERQLKEVQARKEVLKTKEEQRADLDAKEKRLLARLNPGPKAVAGA